MKARNNLGAALAERGDVDGAISCFREAIERDPSYAGSYKNLAIALVAKNRLKDARKSMQYYLKLAPGDAKSIELLRGIMAAIDADTSRGDFSHE